MNALHFVFRSTYALGEGDAVSGERGICEIYFALSTGYQLTRWKFNSHELTVKRGKINQHKKLAILGGNAG